MNLSVPVPDQATTTSYASFTVQGARRKENGDRFLVRDGLAMVVDGISSSRIGADSAAACVEKLETLWLDASATSSADGLREMLRQVNGHLLSRAMMLSSNERRRGGCCVAGMAVSTDGRSAIVFHAGDASVHVSGAYGLRKLTRDHRGACGNAGPTNRIRSALGIVPDPEIEICTVDLMPGERLILATDGCDLEPFAKAGSPIQVASPDEIVDWIRETNATPSDDATVVVIAPECSS